MLSRSNAPSEEWALHPQMVQEIWKIFRKAVVDLFASEDCSQVALSALPPSGDDPDSYLLCPVRALRIYIARSASFRQLDQLLYASTAAPRVFWFRSKDFRIGLLMQSLCVTPQWAYLAPLEFEPTPPEVGPHRGPCPHRPPLLGFITSESSLQLN